MGFLIFEFTSKTMGLTRQYLRYAPVSSFGLISSAKGGLLSVPGSKHLVVAATAEVATVWNLKTGEKTLVLQAEEVGKNHGDVTALAVHGEMCAIGYHDGNISMFSLTNGELLVDFSGHKSSVSSLNFDNLGHRLASGSRDTVVIVWDVVNECGLYRLNGHKGPVTSVAFMPTKNNVLVSSSKDTLVKFWDLDVQHCFKTLTGHLTEVWDFTLVNNDAYLVTGAGDSELRVFKLTFKEDWQESPPLAPIMKKLRVDHEEEDEDNEEEDEYDAGVLKVERVGSLLRGGQDKVSHLQTDDSGRLLVCHGSDNSVEMFLICTPEEVKKRLQKKAKKERRKQGSVETVELPDASIQEEFRRHKVLRASGKVRHVAVDVDDGKEHGLVWVSTANNIIEQFRFDLDVKGGSPTNEDMKLRSFDQAGHRSDVRTVAFSSCNTAVASVSHESLKVWNRNSQACMRSIASGYGLCCTFVPGDRHVIVGTKKGSLQIFDLNLSEMTDEVTGAHEKEVWAMHMTPDRKGFVTASADKTVKFWRFEPSQDGGGWTVVQSRTLQLEEDALAVRVSSDGRLLAVALLDSTVKVFFVDTLKFFLSLYGHKLPVVALDVSSDSALIATGSADKNVKIWGLDFGDCHKSIFAHDDTVTSVQFVPNTHYFFTAGKDGKIKQWDADNFERITTLNAHHGEVWALAVSPNGRFVLSAGHDKTLRLWQKTQEPLVLEDERETEREREDEQKLATGDSRVVPGEQGKEAGLATKRTAESERSAERLMEALEVYKGYREDYKTREAECRKSKKTFVAPPLPLLMTVYPDVANAEEYMAAALGRVKSSELEETLLVLPLDVVVSLLEVIETLLTKGLCCEMVCRTFFFLVEIHFGPLSSSASPMHTKQLLKNIRDLADKRLTELKDTVGFNLAALRYLQHQQEEREKTSALVEAVTKLKDKKRRKKQKQRAVQTAIMSL